MLWHVENDPAWFSMTLYWSFNLKVSLAEEERRETLVKGSPASLASCGRANSAPSNDSGHVSAEPYSLPSVSSNKVSDISYQKYCKTKAKSLTSKTQEMSIASSPPLDLDPAEDLTAEDVILHSTEFTKVRRVVLKGSIQFYDDFEHL